jgi:20S proteasome alpha/beta subunit
MTCIVGIMHEGNVLIGGDSAGVSNYDITSRGDKKVFRNGDFIFGFTTSFRIGQILRYSFIPPTIPDWDLERYMCSTFVDSIREVFKNKGFSETRNGAEKGGTLLVGVHGRLFTIHSDYQVGWDNTPYVSVGCGSHYALGSLYTTHNLDMTPEEKLIVALNAANNFSAGVCPPYHIEKL